MIWCAISLTFTYATKGGYIASKGNAATFVAQWGATIFTSGLLCIIAFYFGDEVEIPATLAT